jgi:hypothetical protein
MKSEDPWCKTVNPGEPVYTMIVLVNNSAVKLTLLCVCDPWLLGVVAVCNKPCIESASAMCHVKSTLLYIEVLCHVKSMFILKS